MNALNCAALALLLGLFASSSQAAPDPSWQYAVPYKDLRVSLQLDWPTRPVEGPPGSGNAPIIDGALFMVLPGHSGVNEGSVSLWFVNRTRGREMDPSLERFIDEEQDTLTRVRALHGDTKPAILDRATVSKTQVGNRTWFVQTIDACMIRYTTTLSESTSLVLQMSCGGLRWSGLKRIERRFSPWWRRIVESIRIEPR